jgi:hypothetical protein
MAEELPSLHIDTDWKKQAQEEKRRLAEEQAKRQAAAAPAAPAAPATGPATGAPAAAAAATGGRTAGAGRGGQQQREMPPASFATLVQSHMTQALYYMGAMATMGGEPILDLDMAKHQIDTLGVLDEKTKNNLTPDEQRLLDLALYETRTRFVSVASQMI